MFAVIIIGSVLFRHLNVKLHIIGKFNVLCSLVCPKSSVVMFKLAPSGRELCTSFLPGQVAGYMKARQCVGTLFGSYSMYVAVLLNLFKCPQISN